MKKKIVSLFLALSLAFSLSVPALAATPEEAQDDAELLYNLGLFLGSSTNPDGTPNFALDRAPTRAEAVTILVRSWGRGRGPGRHLEHPLHRCAHLGPALCGVRLQ